MTDDEAIAGFEAVIARDGRSEDSEARLRVAEALLGKGGSLVGLGRYGEAVLSYESVLERFGKSTDQRKPTTTARGRAAWLLATWPATFGHGL